jgi:hypothetical protein
MIKDFRMRHGAALAWSGAALTISIVLAVLDWLMGFASILIGLPVLIMLALVGVAALSAELRDAVRETRSRTAAAVRAGSAIAIFAAGVVLFLPCIWLTNSAIIWATLLFNHSGYSLIVDEVERGAITRDANAFYRSRHGITFALDSRPPVRVAFPAETGVLDDWDAIVYDPTGAVSQAKGFTQSGEFTAPDSVKTLFGGNVVACSPMITHYYRCTFA